MDKKTVVTESKSFVKRTMALRKSPDAPCFSFSLGFDGKLHKAGDKENPDVRAAFNANDLTVNLISLACALAAVTTAAVAAFAVFTAVFKIRYRRRF